jgi:hypothetical protein
MARTSFAGPVYSEGRPVVTQDQTTGALVAPLPILFPATPGALVVEGEFRDLTLQTGGPALAVPRNVLYGAGGVSSTGIVSVAANGEITVLKAAAIMFKTRLRAGRVGAAGVSIVVIWGEVSIDGGANWTTLPNVSSINLSVADDTITFFDIIPVLVAIGQKFRIRFARAAEGNNSGDLAPQPLSGGLAFLAPVPSAYMAIYRFA